MVRGTDEVLVFEVAGHRLGVPGSSVRELVRAVLVTPVPGSPRFVEGVINLRGRVVPVLDVRQWLGLPAKAIEPADHFLVVSSAERLVALHVDRALEWTRLDAAGVDGGDLLPGAQAKVQVAKFTGGIVLLPDVNTLLAHGTAANFAGALTAESLPQAERSP